MSKHRLIRVYEHEKLTLSDGRGLTPALLDKLIRYNDQFQGKFFTVIHHGIKFSQHVGVIQVRNLTIEILPKADKAAGDDDKALWRRVLIDMLVECRFLNIEHWGHADLDLRKKSILEIYMEMFLDEVERLVREGMIKKYNKTEGNRTALKGQLIFPKNIAKNYIHGERFYVRHSEFNHSNAFNRILLKAVKVIPVVSPSAVLTDRVNRLLFNFPDMPDINVDEKIFVKLPIDRKAARYQQALIAAKMILLNYRPDISTGQNDVIAILFDMNRLWEEFIFRRLKKVAGKETAVTRQERQKFWINHLEKSDRVVKPDILISKNQKNIIVDTKWKIDSGNLPSDDDLRQMFVYNLLWGADRAILLYPGYNREISGSYYKFGPTRGQPPVDINYHSQCQLRFFNLIDDKGKLVGSDAFNELLNTIL